jgi:hypothetical protein
MKSSTVQTNINELRHFISLSVDRKESGLELLIIDPRDGSFATAAR